MTVLVLRRLDGSGIVEEYPNLAAYVARGEARPTYQRAFEAQAAALVHVWTPLQPSNCESGLKL